MRTVFFDVDTQIDFMFPAGGLYVPGAEHIVANVSRLNRWASANRVPLVSTIDAHTENDPEFAVFPPHCVKGTTGQRKPESTLVPGQILVPKQSLDCFTVPELPAILAGLGAQRYVVYGVVTEICVRYAALGLLRTGSRVEIVENAIMHLAPERRDAFFGEFRQAGGTITQLELAAR
jgi:nicotinamidase/pyrazinamidase